MSNTPRFEFFYDCSSPWTYFAFTRVIPLMEHLRVDIRWRPILVGGVFNAVNQQLYAARENMFADKQRLGHYVKDMNDWAELCDIAVGQPDVFPVNSVKAMRGAFFAQEHGLITAYSRAVFEAYWGDNRDISREEVLCELCVELGLDAERFLAWIASQSCKDALRANTEELVARGGYGSPTMFINDDDMYFGNDRLPLVEHRLTQLLAKE